MNAMTEIIDGVKAQSRLFAEPTTPQPSIVRDLTEAIEIANTLTCECRRLENRLVLIQARLANLQTIQRP